MSGYSILVADAITAVLNAAVDAESLTSLTVGEMQALTVRRSYPDWDDDFKGLSALAVDVVPVSSPGNAGEPVELDSETSVSTEPSADVVVRYRFAESDREAGGRLLNASVDKYVALVQELYEKLMDARSEPLEIPGHSANWIETNVRTYCDYRRLREGSFLGVVRLKYNVSKAG